MVYVINFEYMNEDTWERGGGGGGVLRRWRCVEEMGERRRRWLVF
jgi:hypothetical protein